MGGAQVGVGLVEAVAQPVVLQRERLAVVVGGEAAVGVGAGAAGGGDGVLVEVVPEVEDHVDVLGGQVAEGGEVPVVVRLAGDGGQGEGAVTGPGGGRGAGAAGRAGPAAGAESVVVRTAGVQALDVGADAVGELGVGGDRSAPRDAAEALVVGELPGHLDAVRGEAAAGLVGAGRQPGPDEYGAGERVAGGNAEGEGVIGDPPGVELGGARRSRGGQVHREGERGGGSRPGEQTAAVQAGPG
ncbi:hypothetical protein SMICM17S_05376 [Streptomyces microflavus]